MEWQRLGLSHTVLQLNSKKDKEEAVRRKMKTMWWESEMKAKSETIILWSAKCFLWCNYLQVFWRFQVCELSFLSCLRFTYNIWSSVYESVGDSIPKMLKVTWYLLFLLSLHFNSLSQFSLLYSTSTYFSLLYSTYFSLLYPTYLFSLYPTYLSLPYLLYFLTLNFIFISSTLFSCSLTGYAKHCRASSPVWLVFIHLCHCIFFTHYIFFF